MGGGSGLDPGKGLRAVRMAVSSMRPGSGTPTFSGVVSDQEPALAGWVLRAILANEGRFPGRPQGRQGLAEQGRGLGRGSLG